MGGDVRLVRLVRLVHFSKLLWNKSLSLPSERDGSSYCSPRKSCLYLEKNIKSVQRFPWEEPCSWDVSSLNTLLPWKKGDTSTQAFRNVSLLAYLSRTRVSMFSPVNIDVQIHRVIVCFFYFWYTSVNTSFCRKYSPKRSSSSLVVLISGSSASTLSSMNLRARKDGKQRHQKKELLSIHCSEKFASILHAVLHRHKSCIQWEQGVKQLRIWPIKFK